MRKVLLALVISLAPASLGQVTLGNPTTSSAVTLTVTVSTVNSGSGYVNSSDGGILNCTGVCSYSYNSGTNMSLTATPLGSSTVNFSGGTDGASSCTGAGPNCGFMITGDAGLTVTFSSSPSINEYYVSTTGTNTPSGGTQASPWATIAYADSHLSLGPGGAIVHVAAGTYSTGSFTTSHSGTAAARIQFVSDTKWGAHLTSAGWIVTGSYVDINGFDITDPDSSGGWDAIIVSGDFVHVINNYIHNIGDNQTTACPQDGALVVSAANHDALIDSNIIYSTGHRDGNCGGTGGTSNHGIYIAGYHNTITNNLVSKAAGYGLEFYHNACQNVIANNTAFYNFTGGIQIANGAADGLAPCVSSGDAYVSVTNNLIVHNGWGCATSTHHNGGIFFGLSGIGAGNKAYNNYMAGNLTQTACAQTNTIDVYSDQPSPTQAGNVNGGSSYSSLFVNYQDEYTGNPSDYQLASGSAAGGAGVASGPAVCAASPGISPCVPSSDIGGSPRPGTDGLYSIGAYEYLVSTQTNYATNFPLTENPISESNHWVNGQTIGLDWFNVRTTIGLAYGTQTGSGDRYKDSTAILTGTWSANQTACGVAHITNPQTTGTEEVEIRLRSSITPHFNTGYELNTAIKLGGAASHSQIVRWDNVSGSGHFTSLASVAGPGIKDGDTICGNITGTTITLSINSATVVTATDSTYSSGNPGIGFYIESSPGLSSDFGFSSFSAIGVAP